MEITITEFIEFSENKADHVTLIGTVNHYPQDGTFCEDIQWQKSLYTPEENDIIKNIAFKQDIYDQMFAEFEKENAELLIEQFI